MVKVTIELSELEIRMLVNCIEAAIETNHMPRDTVKRVTEIRDGFNKYLLTKPLP
jgi:hypothetical protein